eukprot:6289401-Ditylum_brightwellii.AAC.1
MNLCQDTGCTKRNIAGVGTRMPCLSNARAKPRSRDRPQDYQWDRLQNSGLYHVEQGVELYGNKSASKLVLRGGHSFTFSAVAKR